MSRISESWSREISTLMGYEATRKLPLKEVEIETPICSTTSEHAQGRGHRHSTYPASRSGHGRRHAGACTLMQRSDMWAFIRDPETHEPVEYYCKLPNDIEKREIFVVDPMLATGGSASAAIDFIKARGGRKIIFMCLIAAPEGIEVLQKAHPDVDIFVASKDEKLNEHAYIVPGLGDARETDFTARNDLEGKIEG